MSSQSAPAPTSQARKREPQRASRAPSTQTVITVGIALLILFGWLRLLLTLEIASTERQIQIQTEELASIKRTNDSLRLKIAIAMSPERLAQVAKELGFNLYQPDYVQLNAPLSGQEGLAPVEQAASSETVLAQSNLLWDLAIGEFDTLLEAEAIP